MRKFVYALLGLVLGFAVNAMPALAEDGCGPNQKLALIGSPATASGVISTSGHDVRLIAFLPTSSDGVLGIYDVDTLGETSSAPKLEVGAPASTFAFFPQKGFLDQPLRFDEGITVVGSNLSYVAFYECQSKR